MPGTIYVNGRDLSDVGLEPLSIGGWLDLPSISRSVEPLTNTTGHALGTGVRTAPRQISLSFSLRPQLLTDRAAAMDAVADTLTGLCELRFVDKPNRVIRAYVETVTTVAEGESVAMIEPALILRVGFIGYDAAVYDDEPTVLAVTTTPRAVPLGSIPSGGTLYLMGSLAGSVVVTCRSHTGEAVGTLTLTGTLAADEYLEVSLSDRTITKVNNAGVRDADAYSFKSAGAWFSFDPGHGVRTAGAWPSIEVSAGAAVFIYRKAWAS